MTSRSMSNLPKDVHGSGILGTTAGEEVGLSGLPDRSSVVQLMDFGQSSSSLTGMIDIVHGSVYGMH